MVPRKVARISEYVANRPRSSSPAALGSNQSLASVATPDTSGTGSPAAKVSSSPGRTSRMSPSGRVRVARCSTTTVVAARNVGPSGGVTAGRPSACHCRARKITGTARAVSLSQYWNACTKVIARMPPSATFAVTTAATSRAPERVRGAGHRGQGQPGALELRHQVQPTDEDHEGGGQDAEPTRAQPQLAEVGQGERPGAAQRRGHEEQQGQVAGGEPDRVPEHVHAVLEDQPRDAEEARRRQVLPADGGGVPRRD